MMNLNENRKLQKNDMNFKIPGQELESIAKSILKFDNKDGDIKRKIGEFDAQYPNHKQQLVDKIIDLGRGEFIISKLWCFDFKDEDDRLNVAKKLSSGKTAQKVIDNIAKFELKTSEKKLSLAMVLAPEHGTMLCDHIDKFNIQNEKDRVELAKKLVPVYGVSFIINLNKFNIQSEKERINLAKSLIVKNDVDVARNITKFKIESDKDRVDIVKTIMLKVSGKLVESVILNSGMRLKKIIDRREVVCDKMLEDAFKDIANPEEVKEGVDICKKLIDSQRKMAQFYQNIPISVTFDMEGILGQDNARNIFLAIDNIRDDEQKVKVMEDTQRLLFIIEQKFIDKEFDKKAELAKLIIEFATIRKPELRNYLSSLILSFVNEEKLGRVREEINNNDKKKAYPAINAIVFDRLSLYKEKNKDVLFSLRELMKKNSFLKNSKEVQTTYLAFIKLSNSRIEEHEIRDVLRFLIKNAGDIGKNSKYLMSILTFGDKGGLAQINDKSNPNALNELFYDIYNEYIGIGDNEEFKKEYERFVNLEENLLRNFEERLMLYIANVNEEDVIKGSIGKFITTMSNLSKFRDMRYDMTKSEHLEKLSKLNNEVYEKWTKGQDNFNNMVEGRAKITDDPVDMLLIGTEVDGSCQHVNGLGFNKALMGYVVDGKNKAIVIKNAEGRIMARSIIRLLIEDGTNNIIMAKEKVYKVNGSDLNMSDELEKTCIEYAKWLGISLVTEGYNESMQYSKILVSIDSPAAYEYVDMCYGLTMGKYDIISDDLIYLYKKE